MQERDGLEPSIDAVRARLLWPAIGLIATASLSIVTCLAAAGFSTWLLVDGRAGTGGLSSVPVVQFRLFSECALLLANVAVIVGGVQMLRGRGRTEALVACVLALIPCCGPCFVLGAPFGLWGLTVLRDPAVSRALERPS